MLAYSLNFRNQLLFQAVINGRAEIVALLLGLPNVDPTIKDNKALTHAANGAVAKLLVADDRVVDPNIGKGAPPIVMASAHGLRDVVEAVSRRSPSRSLYFARYDSGLG